MSLTVQDHCVVKHCNRVDCRIGEVREPSLGHINIPVACDANLSTIHNDWLDHELWLLKWISRSIFDGCIYLLELLLQLANINRIGWAFVALSLFSTRFPHDEIYPSLGRR